MPALFDAHCDTAGALFQTGEGLCRNTLHTDLERGGAFVPRGQVYALWQPAEGLSPAELTANFWQMFHNLLFEIQKNADKVALCMTKGDLDAVFTSNRQAALISCEGAELFGCDEAALIRAHGMGLHILHLCWNHDNALCGAAMASGAGLTERGRNFVRLAGKLGVIIDLSHASDRAAWDVLELGCARVLASHSNSRAICNHPRNLPDELLRDIACAGGVVGLNLYPPFLGGRNPGLIAGHARHILDICGEHAVCLGCDFDGVDELPDGIRGIEDIPVVFEALISAGISPDTLEDIFFHNLKYFLERAL
ncbi:MAG: dipeptidase [Oscillospiraceae bacterium]